MAIQFACTCGRTLQAREEHVGRRVRCPACGNQILVPSVSEAVQAAETDPSPPISRKPNRRPDQRIEEEDRPERRARSARTSTRRRFEDYEDDDVREPGESRTSGKAVASLVLGLLALGTTVITGVPAFILGLMSMGEINRSQGRLSGKGLAIAGLVLGILGSLLIIPAGIFSITFFAVTKVRHSDQVLQSQNNLKQMALAIHNYNDHIGQIPEDAALKDKNGKPLLSWRVALLPYIEQDNLYGQFHLDEPWDSPHNKSLIPLMPKTYANPADRWNPQQGLTRYRVFVGPRTAWVKQRDGRPPSILRSIPDGTANTVMIVEAAEAVPWTKPEELVYDPQGPLPQLGGPDPRFIPVAMWDGSVRRVSKNVGEKQWRAAITASNNDIPGPPWYEP